MKASDLLLKNITDHDGAGSGIDADFIRGLPADFTSNLSDIGYQKLPNGLIVQWGTQTQTTDDNGVATYTFPITFPNACYSVSCVDSGDACVDYGVTSLNVSSFTATIRNSNGDIWANKDAGCRFIAIGY